MSKTYKIKVTKKLLKQLKSTWKKAKQAQEEYWSLIEAIETHAKEKTGIDIEVFHSDGELAGIGNYERTMRLIHAYELEK